jgi:hypothetical protein
MACNLRAQRLEFPMSSVRVLRRWVLAWPILVLGLLLADSARAASFVVTTPANASDCDPGDGVCQMCTGGCSLYSAVEELNALGPPGPHSVTVDPAITTIVMNAQLILSVGGVTFDGNGVTLDGNDAANVDGFGRGAFVTVGATTITNFTFENYGSAVVVLLGDYSTVTNCSFHNNHGSGISIQGDFHTVRNVRVFDSFTEAPPGETREQADGIAVSGDYNEIADFTVTGSSDNGVFIRRGEFNVIGGDTLLDTGIIQSNAGYGIRIHDGFLPTAFTTIAGNFISSNLGGISISGGATDTTIGGGSEITSLCDAPCNMVIANEGAGIEADLDVAVPGTTIAGNFVGVTLAGEPMPNGDGYGIVMQNCGEDDAIAHNVVAGQPYGIIALGPCLVEGNHVGVDASGTMRVGDGVLGVVANGGTRVVGNLLSGNQVNLDMGSGVVVQDNIIGVAADGAGTIAGHEFGVGIRVSGAAQNWLIGASDRAGEEGGGNVISRNAAAGIRVNALPSGAPSQGRIQGNWIGTNALGTVARGNGTGVELRGIAGEPVTDVTIGHDSDPSLGNLISGNSIGIHAADVVDVRVVGNRVGGSPEDGAEPLGNQLGGIHVRRSTGAQIGTATSPNTIVNNPHGGILLLAGAGLSNAIDGNWIGRLPDGTPAPNGDVGVYLVSPVNAVGLAAPNVIADNDGPGVWVAGGNGTIANNVIADNAGDGVLVDEGGSADVVTNTITGNGGHGVAVRSTEVLMRQNVMADNALLAISLAGEAPLPNDPGDQDDGFNHGQNYPLVTEAIADGGGSCLVRGEVDGEPRYPLTVEIFTVSACDPSGHGEADRFVGNVEVTPGTDRRATFEAMVAPCDPGEIVTATASFEATVDTSELSACVLVSEGDPGELAAVRFAVGGASPPGEVSAATGQTGVVALQLEVRSGIAGVTLDGLTVASSGDAAVAALHIVADENGDGVWQEGEAIVASAAPAGGAPTALTFSGPIALPHDAPTQLLLVADMAPLPLGAGAFALAGLVALALCRRRRWVATLALATALGACGGDDGALRASFVVEDASLSASHTGLPIPSATILLTKS